MRGIVGGAAALLMLGLAGSAAAETLRVGGTGGALDMIRHVGVHFTASKGIDLDIAMSLGSNGSLRALADGILDMAVTARPLTGAENKNGFVVVPIARTALVFATSQRNPDSIKSTELPKVYTSSRPTWADATPLRIILRTKLDADTVIISDLFPGMREALAAARERQDLPVAATDQDNTKMAESMRGSLMFGGLSQLEMERRELRYVPIDGMLPSLANFASRAYPYEKVFYLVFPSTRSAVAQRFFDFVHSEYGRQSLRGAGALPVDE